MSKVRRERRKAHGPILSLNTAKQVGVEPVSSRSYFRVLVGHYLERFFNNELMSADGESKMRWVQMACVIGLPEFIFTLYLYPLYHMPRAQRPYWARAGDHSFYPLYTFTATIILTVFAWDFFFPDLLDTQVLSHLPVKRAMLFRGRVTAIVILFVGFFVDSSILAPLVLPAATDPEGLLRFLAAHLLAVGCSSVFAASFVLAVEGLLLALLGEQLFRRISLWLQGLMVAGSLTLLSLYPVMFAVLPSLTSSMHRWVVCIPSLWFAGIYQSILQGAATPVSLLRLARIGYSATAVTAMLAVVIYPLAYWRRNRAIVEGTMARQPNPRLRRQEAVQAWIVQSSRGRAVWSFISQTIRGVPRYRAYLVLYGGAGVALVAASVLRAHFADGRPEWSISQSGLRAALAIVAFWTVAGLHTVFRSAADRRGLWIFHSIHGRPCLEHLDAARRWVFWHALGLTLITLLVGFAWDRHEWMHWRFAAAQSLLAFGVCLLLTDAFFLHVRFIPFTRRATSASSNLALVLVPYIALFPCIVMMTVALGVWMAASSLHLLLAAMAMAAAHFWLTSMHDRDVAANAARDLMEEEEDEFPMKLGLL